MIKYLDIKGYRNCGECGFGSHVYQWVEEGKETPIIILINAFEGEPKAFKGYLYNKTKTFVDVPIINNELAEIQNFIGEIKQQDFRNFIKGTVFEDNYNDYIADIS